MLPAIFGREHLFLSSREDICLILAAFPDMFADADGASLKEKLKHLGELNQLMRSVMEGVFKALWPRKSMSESQLALSHHLQEARA